MAEKPPVFAGAEDPTKWNGGRHPLLDRINAITGTFSAAAAAISFQGQRQEPAKETARNTKETVRLLKSIDASLENSGAVFV